MSFADHDTRLRTLRILNEIESQLGGYLLTVMFARLVDDFKDTTGAALRLTSPGWSQRVGAKRHPMTGSAQSGSISSGDKGPGLRFAPPGLRIRISNSHRFAISRPDTPEVCFSFPLSEIRGRRECRAPDAPDNRVCGGSGRKHTRQSGHTGITRHSPRNGLTAYFALSPATGSFATVIGGITSANLTPASGCQDHTTLPSA
jgi:hypothetical protein